jgi:hypothetical protein
MCLQVADFDLIRGRNTSIEIQFLCEGLYQTEWWRFGLISKRNSVEGPVIGYNRRFPFGKETSP